jgi:hypothetical protein
MVYEPIVFVAISWGLGARELGIIFLKKSKLNSLILPSINSSEVVFFPCWFRLCTKQVGCIELEW